MAGAARRMNRTILRSPIALVERDWTFVPSPAPFRTRVLRGWHRATARLPAPPQVIVRPLTRAKRWNLLFLFSRDGRIDAAQREILKRLRGLTGRLFVVYAGPAGTDLPSDLDLADALVRKGSEGFDFSAYALGLTLVAEHSPGADVYVQNDSVLGPLGDVDMLVGRAGWDLTGFMASAAVENHISTFAFILKSVTLERVASLSAILSDNWCYGRFDPVVLMQETRFARIAHRRMSVGAFFYMPVPPAARSWRQRASIWRDPASATRYPLDVRGDATLGSPLELLDAGFPFLKRSLFGKFTGVADDSAICQRLIRMGWPADAIQIRTPVVSSSA
jgi:hypothetical protein